MGLTKAIRILYIITVVAITASVGWGGNALNFDGAGDVVNVSDNNSLEGFEEMSISVWIKKAADSDPNEDTIISKWASDYTYCLRYDSADNELDWLIGNAGTYDSCINPVSIEDANWHHIVAVYDGSTGYVYLDSFLLGDTATLGIAIGSNDSPLQIGASPHPADANNHFKGSIDDVRIYDKALSVGQIEHLCHDSNTTEPNLVGYWNLDQGQGQSADDISGNGNDGSLGSDPCSSDINDPVWVESDLPYCQYHIDVADGNDLNNGLSLETAFKTIQYGIDTSKNGDVVLVYPGVYTEELEFLGRAITVKSIDEPAVLRAPGYYAVSFYYGEDANSIFKNFIIKDSDTAFLFVLPVSPTIRNVTVVENQNGALAEDGTNPDISNSIFWNNVNGDLFLCQATYSLIEDKMGLVANWQFDEGSGGTAYDSAGNNDGTIYGDTNWTAGQVASGALDFDGSEDYVVIADDIALTPADQMTVTYWIYQRAGQEAGIYKYALCPDEPGSPGNSRAYFLEVDTGGKVGFRIYSTVNDYNDIQSINSVPFGQWHHIAASFDQGRASIYIDGQLDNSAAMSVSSIMNDDQPLTIGGFWSYCGTDSFVSRLDGKIDDVRIYDRPLPAGQIWRLYELGLRGYGFGPIFVDANNGDYRLKSEGWRWSKYESQWVYDDVTSPCIDAGNPGSPLANEPLTVPRDPENVYGVNLRVNMGAFGTTAQAGIAPHGWALLADLNNDGTVDFLDLDRQLEDWLAGKNEQPGDLNRDGFVDMIDYAILAENWLEQLF